MHKSSAGIQRISRNPKTKTQTSQVIKLQQTVLYYGKYFIKKYNLAEKLSEAGLHHKKIKENHLIGFDTYSRDNIIS